jgi:hypothetical protein
MMALVYYHNEDKNGNQRREIISAKQGTDIWQILKGEVEPTEAQQDFVDGVERVILSWRDAPASYIEANLEMLREHVVMNWTRNRQGDYTRPEPDDAANWDFSRKYGLWDAHGKSTLAMSISNKLKSWKYKH